MSTAINWCVTNYIYKFISFYKQIFCQYYLIVTGAPTTTIDPIIARLQLRPRFRFFFAMDSSATKWLNDFFSVKVHVPVPAPIPTPPPTKIAKKKVTKKKVIATSTPTLASVSVLPSYASLPSYSDLSLSLSPPLPFTSSLMPSSSAFEFSSTVASPPSTAVGQQANKRRREEPMPSSGAESAIAAAVVVVKVEVQDGKEEKEEKKSVPVPVVAATVPLVAKEPLTVKQQMKNIVDFESNLATMVRHWRANPKLQFTATIDLTQQEWAGVVSILEHKAGLTNQLGSSVGRTDTAMGVEEFDLYFEPTMAKTHSSSASWPSSISNDAAKFAVNKRDQIRVITDRNGTIKKAVVLQPRDDAGIYNIVANLDLVHAKPLRDSTESELADDEVDDEGKVKDKAAVKVVEVVDPLAGLFDQPVKQQVPLIVLKDTAMNFNLDAEENYPVHQWMTKEYPLSYRHSKLISFYSPRGDFRFDCLDIIEGVGMPMKPETRGSEVKSSTSSPPSSSSSSPLKIDFLDEAPRSLYRGMIKHSYQLRIVPLTTAWDNLKLDKSKSPSKMGMWVASKKRPFPCVKGLRVQVPKSLTSPVSEWVDNLLFKCLSVPFNIAPGPPTDSKLYRLVFSIVSVDGVSWQTSQPFRTQRQIQEQQQIELLLLIESAKSAEAAKTDSTDPTDPTDPVERGEVTKKLRVL